MENEKKYETINLEKLNWYELMSLHFNFDKIIEYVDNFVLQARKSDVVELKYLFTSTSFKQAIEKLKKYNHDIFLEMSNKICSIHNENLDYPKYKIDMPNYYRNSEYEFETLLIIDESGYYTQNINDLAVPNIPEIQKELDIIANEINNAKVKIEYLRSKGLIKRRRY